MDNKLIHLWVRAEHLAAAINALLFHGSALHNEARQVWGFKKARAIRAEAEEAFAARNVFQQQGRPSVNAGTTIRDNSAPVQTNRQVNRFKFPLPKGSRDILIATVMAMSIVVNVFLGYLLHDAYKNIQTQVWLRQDKDEEHFMKFVAGPYAQLAGKIEADEELKRDILLLQALGNQQQQKEQRK